MKSDVLKISESSDLRKLSDNSEIADHQNLSDLQKARTTENQIFQTHISELSGYQNLSQICRKSENQKIRNFRLPEFLSDRQKVRTTESQIFQTTRISFRYAESQTFQTHISDIPDYQNFFQICRKLEAQKIRYSRLPEFLSDMQKVRQADHQIFSQFPDHQKHNLADYHTFQTDI